MFKNQLILDRSLSDYYWHDLTSGNKHDLILKRNLFNELQNYHIGLFKVVNNNPTAAKFELMQNKIYKYLWRYGELFITFFNDEIQLWSVVAKYNDGLKINHVKAQLIYENIPLYFQDSLVITLINNVQGVYVTWEENITPAIVKYWHYINDQVEFFNAWKLNVKLDTKKFIYMVNNNSEQVVQRELASFLDPVNPFILNVNPTSVDSVDTINLIKEINTSTSNSAVSFDNLQNLRSWYKDVLGLVVPNDNKKERKNLTETMSETYGTENIETVILNNLRNFGRQVEAITGDVLEFEETNQVIIDQTELIKNNQGGNDETI